MYIFDLYPYNKIPNIYQPEYLPIFLKICNILLVVGYLQSIRQNK